jgi:hypothetical protein
VPTARERPSTEHHWPRINVRKEEMMEGKKKSDLLDPLIPRSANNTIGRRPISEGAVELEGICKNHGEVLKTQKGKS